MRDHERIEELIAARALGGLDAPEGGALREEMAAHGPDCAECRRLEAEYDEAAGRLGFALDAAPVREGFEDEVVGRALAGRPARIDGAARPGPARVGRGARLRALVALAASFALFAGGWAIGTLTSGAEVAIPGDARVVAFEGEGDATLSVAYRPGEDGIYLLGTGLEPQPKNKVYEVWLFRGETPVRGGCFRPTDEGSVFRLLDAEVGAARLMAVTVESSACPTAPTSPPILTAEV